MGRIAADRGEKRKLNNGGFTLVEMLVVMVILAILASVSIFGLTNWIRNSTYTQHEEYARTTYYAVSQGLTYAANTDSDEQFFADIENAAGGNSADSTKTGSVWELAGTDTTIYEDIKERIYAVVLTPQDYENYKSGSSSAFMTKVYDMLSNYIVDQSVLDASIAIEFDMRSKTVYSVFYSGWAEEITYEPMTLDACNESGRISLSTGDTREASRSYGARKEMLLGYYSTEDLANVASLSAKKLRVTTASLNNEETLNLVFSSNESNQMILKYNIQYYDAETKTQLCTMEVDFSKLAASGYTSRSTLADVTVTMAGKTTSETFTCPLTIAANGNSTTYYLVLDAMMSADLMDYYNKFTGNTQTLYAKSNVMSASRFFGNESKEVYAAVSVEPNENINSLNQDYIASASVRTQTRNTLFGNDSDLTEASAQAETYDINISTYRHLYNMRFLSDAAQITYASNHDEDEITYHLNARNLRWNYAISYATAQGGESAESLERRSGEETVFTSVPFMYDEWTFDGEGHTLTGVQLTEESVADYTIVSTDTQHISFSGDNQAAGVGIVLENSGTIQNLTLNTPQLYANRVADDNQSGSYITDTSALPELQNAAILCAENSGSVQEIDITDAVLEAAVVYDSTSEEQNASADQGAGIGLVAGCVHFRDAAQSMEAIEVSGNADGEIVLVGNSYSFSEETINDAYLYAGIGGVAGYIYNEATGVRQMEQNGQTVNIAETATVGSAQAPIRNNADVTGNMYTGGIVGNMYVDTDAYADVQADSSEPQIDTCENYGLIQCSYRTNAMQEGTMERPYFNANGFFVGGIIGFAQNVTVKDCISSMGEATDVSKYQNGEGEKSAETCIREDINGYYVGGIVGYGNGGMIFNCRTGSGGYVLGDENVGGIAGGLSDMDEGSQQIQHDTNAVVNASYVIGNSYVGGIVGKNTAGSTIYYCINNGIVAGYGIDIGGIAGANIGSYNAETGEITYALIDACTSYIFDYTDTLYQMTTQTWNADGSNVGGIAGYNEYGRVRYDSSALTAAGLDSETSVSSIVAGRNNVGGVIGFNDVHGDVDVDFRVIGGKISGQGDCVGGYIGLNMSDQIFYKTDGNGVESVESFVVQPYSVDGRYMVGGVIGANMVVSERNEIQIGVRAYNPYASMEGISLVGGVIGYNRIFTNEAAADSIDDDSARAEQQWATRFVSFDETTHMISDNDGFVTGNTAVTIDNVTNTINIRAANYAGGILGKNAESTVLTMQQCVNRGNVIEVVQTDDVRVDMDAFLELETEEQFAETVTMPLLGSMTGYCSSNMVISGCVNEGRVVTTAGVAGITEVNFGTITDCTLSSNLGAASYDYVAGIAIFNKGVITDCTVLSSVTIQGSSEVGGIAAINYATIEDCEMIGTISASNTGANVGGYVGENRGRIRLQNDSSLRLRVSGGSRVGGMIGLNLDGGTLTTAAGTSGEETLSITDGSRISGTDRVGGIIGEQQGGNLQRLHLVNRANVSANTGFAGGIVGLMSGGTLENAVNYGTIVTASGYAGGITAVNGQVNSDETITDGGTLRNCANYADVTSTSGEASGITAYNAGTITECEVSTDEETITITSHGAAVAALTNINDGTIRGSKVNITAHDLQLRDANASQIGALAGRNNGQILASGTGSSQIENEVVSTGTHTFSVETQMTGGSMGGAVGYNAESTYIREGVRNSGNIEHVQVTGIDFTGFSCKYLGGVCGENLGRIADAQYTGDIYQSGAAQSGNCYGGIAGINGNGSADALLENAQVIDGSIRVVGAYSASSSSTAAQKEQLSSSVGGVAGKNETAATISGCTLNVTDGNECDLYDGSVQNQYIATNGMLGGITGYNKGTITLSGEAATSRLMENGTITDIDEITAKEESSNPVIEYFQASEGYFSSVRSHTYTQVASQKADFELYIGINNNGNGNVGGIAGYNAPTGLLSYCASGKWAVRNTSYAIDASCGGVIGANETEHNMSYLANFAYVERQVANYSSGITNRFAGGVIGNQQNSTTQDWVISDCVNYGMIYNLYSHYVGGIIGEWSYNGGTVQDCHNYGNMQTTYRAQWVGAAGGIVGIVYHPTWYQSINISSCKNSGSIYGSTGMTTNGANDSAGILGNITPYASTTEIPLYVNISDCVNERGVNIYSGSMASGIFGYLSSDQAGTDLYWKADAGVVIRIDRCRNYANRLLGGHIYSGFNFSAGIFGDRGDGIRSNDGVTYITNCFSVGTFSGGWGGTVNPIAFGHSTVLSNNTCYNNYYVDLNSLTNTGTIGTSKTTGTLDWDNYELETEHVRGNARRLYVAGYTANGTQRYLANYFASSYDGSDANKWERTLLTRIDFSSDFIANRCYTLEPFTALYTPDGESDRKVADALLDFTDLNNNRRANLTDITDDAVIRYYQNILDAGTAPLSPTDIAMEFSPENETRYDGNYKVSWNMTENSSVDYYEYEVYAADSADETVRAQLENGGADLTEAANLSCVVTAQRTYEMEGAFEPLSEWAELFAENEYLYVRVRAHNSNGYSAWAVSEAQQMIEVLTIPSVRGEIISNGDSFIYQYRVADETRERYEALAGEGWNVKMTVGNSSLTFDRDHLTAEAAGEGAAAMTIQGISNSPDVLDSATYTTQSYTPVNFLPTGTIDKRASSTRAYFTGTLLEDLSCTAELVSRNTYDIAPVYRVELVIENSGVETTIAYEDVAAVSSGTAAVTFSNLPESVLSADQVFVRWSYVQTGLGPIYTYHEVTDATEIAARNYNIRTLESDGAHYYYSIVLDAQYADTFEDYYGICSLNPTVLDAPVIEEPELSVPTDGSGEMTYTYAWDKNAPADGRTYRVELYGINYTIDAEGNLVIASNRQITLPQNLFTNGNAESTAQRSIAINADEWTYDAVRLVVTRLGAEQSGHTVSIGQSSEETWAVKRRLQRVDEPIVELLSLDGLDYRISWSAISTEYLEYLKEYNVCIRYEDGAETKTEVLGVAESGEATTMQYDLELYSGKDVEIFIRAKAIHDGDAQAVPGTAYVYEDAMEGYVHSLTIPQRMVQPEVTFSGNWNDAASGQSQAVTDAVVSESAFINELQVRGFIREDNPLEGNYLLAGFILTTTEAAEKTLTQLNEAEQNGNIAIMDAVEGMHDALIEREELLKQFTLTAAMYRAGQSSGTDADGNRTYEYISDLQRRAVDSTMTDRQYLEFAGRYLIPLVRSVSSSAISSVWGWQNQDGILQLPRVQLDEAITTETTTMTSSSGTYIVNSNGDAGALSDVTLPLRTINWTSNIFAEAYDTTVTMEDSSEHRLRVRIDGEAPTQTLNVLYGEVSGDTVTYPELDLSSYTSETTVDSISQPAVTNVVYKDQSGDVCYSSSEVAGSGIVNYYEYVIPNQTLSARLAWTAETAASQTSWTQHIYNADGSEETEILRKQSIAFAPDDELRAENAASYAGTAEVEISNISHLFEGNITELAARYRVTQHAKMHVSVIDDVINYSWILPDTRNQQGNISFTAEYNGNHTQVVDSNADRVTPLVSVQAAVFKNTAQYVSANPHQVEEQ